MRLDTALIRVAWFCKCPRCKSGNLYKKGFCNIVLRDKCAQCNLDFSKNDSADGPAVFLIFILGTLLVPLAFLLEVWIAPPLWVHAVLWLCVTLGLTIGLLRPIKAYIIALQFKHRPNDWM